MLKPLKNNTAILVFANSASKEFEQKPFVKNPTLFEAFNQETLCKVKKTGLPYFHISEKQQNGTSFGERFVNAIQEIYNKGYENVITIGNDSPQLKAQHLLKAYQQLQMGKTVLGPTFDGGFYLMGLNRKNFDSELFKRLPWQRFSLLSRISQLFENRDSHLFRLPVFQDLDTIEDVNTILNYTKLLSKTLKTQLSALKNKVVHLYNDILAEYKHTYTSLVFNKGSPSLFL